MAKKEPAIIKRDSRQNWEKSNYIPKENVIIIMDNPDNSISLMIGDGVQTVNELRDLLRDLNGAGATSTATVDEEGTLML